MKEAKPLPPRWQAFVGAYVQNGGNGAQAAIAAGFKPHSAKHRAWSLLQRPDVQAAISAGRERIREDYRYDTERAMKDLDDAIKFSRETKNATAMCRAIELQARIAGVLSDSLSLKVNSIDLGGALIEARKRRPERAVYDSLSLLSNDAALQRIAPGMPLEILREKVAAKLRADLDYTEYTEVIAADDDTAAPAVDPFA